MANRYVPPALRAKGQGREDVSTSRADNSNRSMTTMSTSPGLRGGISAYGSGDSSSPRLRGGDHSPRPLPRDSEWIPDEDLYSLREIQHYFWPEEDLGNGVGKRQSKTLHDSAATPGVLAYVLLFKDANPRWETDGIIYTKSSLELLPAQPAIGANNAAASASGLDVKVGDSNDPLPAQLSNTRPGEAHAPEAIKENHIPTAIDASDVVSGANTKERHAIAVFSQVRRPPYDADSTKMRTFRFTGYFNIAKLQLLQPHSPELLRMLEQKWTLTNPRTGQVRHRQRDAKGWEESLKLRWAVIKFEKDDNTDAVRGKPQIARLEDDEGDDVNEKKGVNEMLRELRMKDSGATNEIQQANVDVDRKSAEEVPLSQQKQKLDPDRQSQSET
ncbi:hypothetical protein G647_03768 [Cladophialophora carrionii CBS 160.54]|uniref:Uncharacterized protein n=1 Tax=Cladophialophora carrionii CBS 160.54 TaxID=1279043 RepID=V9DBZ0_9EURO|nr:uncharacterized protein G647_03768 [Cladophialophora carrionii CBS 160.54]ETI24399.1 hypothetical protein G647_03768 [Cladophialophora carrionii CBS 160.54]